MQIPVGSDTMPAQVFLPASGRGPGIVLVQEIFGVTAYVERRAADLAALGYAVLVPTFYWRLPDAGPLEGPDALEAGMALANRFDWEQGVADAVAAVRWLRASAYADGRVGLVGFCFGGGLAFNVAAVEPVDALVSYYGSALPGLLDLAPQVHAPSIHHFGLADSFLDTETVARIREAVTARPHVDFFTYEGADHAFDNDDFPLHHAEASALAWDRTVAFLAGTLPTSDLH